MISWKKLYHVAMKEFDPLLCSDFFWVLANDMDGAKKAASAVSTSVPFYTIEEVDEIYITLAKEGE